MKIFAYGIALSALGLAACSEPADTPAEDAIATPVGPEATTAANAQPSEPYDGPIPMPIRIGGDGPDQDSCGTRAEVANLEAGNESYLGVNDAPADGVKERDRIAEGRQVKICTTEGDWSGIVYPAEDQDLAECGTSSPVATEQNYTGPCRQGWVESRYLKTVAG